MSVENVELWVSSLGAVSPYYRFYLDSLGTQELPALIFDAEKSYTFFRLNNETAHPFYVSDVGYTQASSGALLITGDGSPSQGIVGGQSFKIEFTQSAGEIYQLLYYCSVHPSMQAVIDLDDEATGALTITGATGTGPASWEQVGADIDAEAAGDEFGTSVSLSADGSTVAIGAPVNGGNGDNSGHVRIYQLNSSTNAWEQVGADIDGEAARDWAGYSVSLSADGSTVAIGARGNDGNGNDSGHVRIYQHNGSSNVWEQVGADIDGEAAYDYSGGSISLSADGSSVAIGAIRNDGNGDNSGHVRIYQLNSSTNAWEQIGADIDGEAIDDFSGVSVSLSADGSTVAIGATENDGGDSNAGHVRIYQRNTNGNWEQVGADIDGEESGDDFGASVSLSADGSTVAIGARFHDGYGNYRNGHVRIYERKSNGKWEQVSADIDGEATDDESGTSVSLSADGSIIAIGAPKNDGNGDYAGHVRIYQRNGATYSWSQWEQWDQVGADIDGEAAGDYFGSSVSLSADGSIIAIGAPENDGNGDYAGHVRIYQRNAPTQPQQGDILSANLADAHDADGTIQSTTYQWQSSSDNGLSWSDLSGETNRQLDTSAQSLVGQDVRVIATTTDPLGGTTSFISAAQTIANVDDEATGLLSIIGAVEEGGLLTAWLNAVDPDVAITHANYKWQETSNNGLTWSDLQGYTKTNQLRIPADHSWVGKTIRVIATTTDALGGTSTFSSAAQTIANADDAATGILSITGATGPGPASWLQVGADIDGEAAYNESGGSVSLSADGSTVAIGAKKNGGNGTSSGHVRIYQRNSDGNWFQVGADIDGEDAYDWSGHSVSISANGSTVAIGAPRNDGNGYRAGHVRIYERKINGNWEQVGADIDGEAIGDGSGSSVSLSADGSILVIGATDNDSNGTNSGHVRIYERKTNGNWEQVGAGINGEVPGDSFGSSVSLSADGSIIAIGAMGNDGNGTSSGHVRIYERKSNGYWEQVGADIDGEAAYDYSGGSVSLSADGSTVAIGARHNSGNGSRSGHVRIYQRNGATYPWEQWEQVGADIDGEAAYDVSGTSVSLSADGSTVAIGASSNDGNGDYAGHVRIFQLNSNGNWQQLGADIDGEAADDDSGSSVSLSADGSTVAIGAQWNDGNGSGSGHVRIYQLNATTQAQQGDILSANFSNVQDADGDIQSTIYQWQSSSDNGLSWSDLSGETNRQLDTSAQSLVGHDVRVTATTTDALGGSTSFTSTVRTIANVDEAASGTLTISGIAEEGGTLTASLNVVDADGSIQSISYQWQSSSDNGLSWSDLSATNQQLNTSAKSLVGQDVRVIATTTDAFGGSTSFTSTSRTIAADTSAPIFTSTGTATAIDENSGAGQIIYAAVARDNSSIAYSLRNNNNDDAASFSIDTATGKVSLNEDPDYETRSVYSFTVLAVDNAGNSSEQSISLSIKDMSEWPAIQSINTVRAKKKVATFSLRKPLAVEEQKLDAAIVGTNKKDKISGSAKNEILAGFRGKDILKGGGGADGFLFDKTIGFGKKQMDKILDFDSEELDKILVDRKAFRLSRKIKFRAVNRKSQLMKASRTKVDFVYENKTGLLYFNENGKKSGFGGGGLFAQLQGKPELFADDFRIV